MSSTAGRLLLLLFLLFPGLAAAQQVSAVPGDFFYAQNGDDTHTPAGRLHYQVQPSDYHGTPAWHIRWHCPQLEAEHFIRRSDGAPLYVKRSNHLLQRTVEIRYSQRPGAPHKYRLKSKDEYIERNIYGQHVRDLGSLPQLLLTQADNGFASEVHFSSIHYANGKVYDFVAKPRGFRSVRIGNKRIRCAIYAVNLDSWMAILNRTTYVLIPTENNSNFAIYEGPDIAGSGGEMSLRLTARGVDVVSLPPQAAAN